MILPIGHEDGTVGRPPLVTFGIVALCLLAHLWVVAGGDAERELERRWREAVEFALEHPELTPPEGLLPDELGAGVADARRERGVTATAGDQRRLDELAAAWREARSRHPIFRHGLVPAAPRPDTLLTHLFLHGGWLHLLGNLLILYLSAPFLEEAWGRGRFALFYLAAGLAAGGLYALQHRHLEVPLIGASGAVAGVLGAFLLLRGRSRIRFAVFLGFVGTFTAPAWVMLPLWFLGELLDAMAGDIAGSGGGGVAYWAHVWGFLFGMAWAGLQQKLRPVAPRPTVRRERADPRLAEAQRLLDRGLYPHAWELLAAAAKAPGAGEAALAAWWRLAVHLGRQHEALAAARDLLRRLAREGRWQEGVPLLAEVVEHLEQVQHIDGSGAPGGAAHGAPAGNPTVEGARVPELAALELRLAESAAAPAPAVARDLVSRALGRELGPGLRVRAERLRDRLDAVGPGAADPTPAG
jgi:membrane associated rhomboid family serine protease